MIHHPPDSAAREAVAARVSNGSAIVCATCGCRLGPIDAISEADTVYWHFRGAPGRDARGCTVPCLTAPHHFSADAVAPHRGP